MFNITKNVLLTALKNKEFFLTYQPQIDYTTGGYNQAEVLIRWHHPQFGLVNTEDWITKAEESIAIYEIGYWVLEQACTQLQSWHQKGLSSIKLAINITYKQLCDSHFMGFYQKILTSYALNVTQIELELVERQSVLNNTTVINVLTDLADQGVSIALDDFGSGFNNFNSLLKLPINKIKLDRAFCSMLPNHPRAVVLFKILLQLCNELQWTLLVEGVETQVQHNFLINNQCAMGQGFFYSPPLSPKDYENFLLKNS